MYLNTINTSNNTNIYIKNDSSLDTVISENPKLKKSDITEEQLLADRKAADIFKTDSVKQSMCADFSSLVGISGYSNISICDNTPKIDALADMAQKYTKYINENFDGDKKQDYLNSLSSYVNSTKASIASEITSNISEFFKLSAKDADDVKSNINSIIDNRLNNTKSTKESTSLKDMNYDDLKTLNASIEGISKSLYNDFYSSENVDSRVGAMGMAEMKTSFIQEKTNLPSNIKIMISDRVNNEISKGIDEVCAYEKLSEHLKKVFNHENDDSYNNPNNDMIEKFRQRVLNTYKKFKDIKFDTDFMNNFINMMNNYSDDDHTSDWDNFVDKVYEKKDRSKYYLPSTKHNIINSFA